MRAGRLATAACCWVCFSTYFHVLPLRVSETCSPVLRESHKVRRLRKPSRELRRRCKGDSGSTEPERPRSRKSFPSGSIKMRSPESRQRISQANPPGTQGEMDIAKSLPALRKNAVFPPAGGFSRRELDWPRGSAALSVEHGEGTSCDKCASEGAELHR